MYSSANFACPGRYLIAEFLRRPTHEDPQRIQAGFEPEAFPGCIGALHCAGWAWHKLAKALQGNHVGKEGKPTLMLEAICDLYLRVWDVMFVIPGMLNDLNTLG